MTALPTIAFLRRHALPASVLDHLTALPAPRPRLAARWSVGEHGRPVCRWTVDLASAPPDPAPPEAPGPG